MMIQIITLKKVWFELCCTAMGSETQKNGSSSPSSSPNVRRPNVLSAKRPLGQTSVGQTSENRLCDNDNGEPNYTDTLRFNRLGDKPHNLTNCAETLELSTGQTIA